MLKVLQSMQEVERARALLEQRSLSFLIPPRAPGLLDRFRAPHIAVGDTLKSWDVSLIAQTIDAHVSKDDHVLDMGAFGSEILLVLQAMGFRKLTGVDLNPLVRQMPMADRINYTVCDFNRTPFPSGSMGAITSVSAIEHGNSTGPLLQEVSRLLKVGGIFAGSTDYWPEKIATDGIEMFGLSWTIYSRQEMQDFFKAAADVGLEPLGECEFNASGRPVHCADRDYTFAAFFLRKRA